ncbi:MAG: response regulator [Labilithrix sp.]|nr:response regulator [Labilithrix sp.]MCW5809740.1 response regulator [Labilithrix sp.]
MSEPVVSSSKPSSGKPPSQPMRLLVVDDNDDNSNLLSRRLKSKGYQVDIASDGPSALEACAKVTYDAILLDVMMPGMSGIEVLTKLREKHAKTQLAVIMATAKDDSSSVVDALKKGANDYVTKPIDFPVLLARLETHLAMKAEAAKAAAAAATKVDVTFGIAPGTVLCGRYEILEKRGEGGFAVVYKARQISTNREVALKHLRPDVLGARSDRVHLERFERESKLIGELNHPNVVRLIDSGSVSVRPSAPPSTPLKDAADDPAATASQTRKRQPDGDPMNVPYIVMELLAGESLADLIDREAPLAPSRAVDLILPVLSALHAAHEKGVVHRDVKPSNIMLSADDRGGIEPKVLDFGIAKLTTQDKSDLTVTSSLIGTPQYMPPEQAFGKKDLDARADQFSAAAVLYQMLTGRPLYSGESFLELVSNVLAGTFTPLADAKPGLEPALVTVVSRALAAERESRHSSVMAFGRALLPFATDRGARRWTDQFAKVSLGPPSSDDVLHVSIERSERAPPVGPATVANTEVGQKLLVAPEPAVAVSGTAATVESVVPLEPPPPAAPAPAKPAAVARYRPTWERIALLAIVTTLVSYLLARYL